MAQSSRDKEERANPADGQAARYTRLLIVEDALGI
jgi:hypothetical protein